MRQKALMALFLACTNIFTLFVLTKVLPMQLVNEQIGSNFKRLSLLICLACGFIALTSASIGEDSSVGTVLEIFFFRGAKQMLKVPASVNQITAVVYGAQGGDPTYGGKGGYKAGI